MINEISRMLMETAYGNASRFQYEHLLGDAYCGGWVFYVNAEKGVTVVRNEATNQKCVVRLSKGDKFDVYTGICIGLFNLLYGIPYWRLNRLMEQFALVDETHDPTAKFVCKYVEDALGINRDDVESEYKIASEHMGKGNTVVFGFVNKPSDNCIFSGEGTRH